MSGIDETEELGERDAMTGMPLCPTCGKVIAHSMARRLKIQTGPLIAAARAEARREALEEALAAAFAAGSPRAHDAIRRLIEKDLQKEASEATK